MSTDSPDIPQKQCIKCNYIYPLTADYFRWQRGSPYKKCRKCLNEEKRIWDRKNGRKSLNKFHHAKPNATTKICSKCKTEKPLYCFYPDKYAGILKRSSQCSLCINPLKSENYVQKPLPFYKICNLCGIEKPTDEFAHSKKLKGSGFAYMCKKCASDWHKQHHKDHYEEYREAAHRRYDAKIAKGNFTRRTQRHDKGLMNLCEQNARLRAAAMDVERIEKVDYVKIYHRDKHECYICGMAISLEHNIQFDHGIPLTRGGWHIEDNIRLAHACCNGRKHNQLLEEMTPFQRRGPSM